jgi:hypothetical protein
MPTLRKTGAGRRGEPLDIRADIYAVGATLYYLLTGQPPFDAKDLRELVSRVTSEPPRSPRVLRRGIPAGLAAVVLQCLAKVPGARPNSYADLAEALRPFLPAADLPAKPGLRFVAGCADSAILSVPVLMVLFLTTRLGATGPMGFVSALAVGSLYAFVLAVPGGVPTRFIGLAVVTRDGSEIGRLRSLARTLIAWAPILVWLVSVPAQIDMGLGPASVQAISLAFGAMIA